MGRRSPHARSRMSALGAYKAADSPTPFEEVCLRFGLMTGPSIHFGLKRFRGKASGQPNLLPFRRKSITRLCIRYRLVHGQLDEQIRLASQSESFFNTGIASYLSGHQGVTVSRCKTRYKTICKPYNLQINRSNLLIQTDRRAARHPQPTSTGCSIHWKVAVTTYASRHPQRQEGETSLHDLNCETCSLNAIFRPHSASRESRIHVHAVRSG